MLTTTTPLCASRLAILPRLGSGAGLKSAAINPHHHRQLRIALNFGSPHIQVQTIFAGTSSRETPCLHKSAPACSARPNSVAFLTPSHAATGCGSFHRSGPTGGAAKGMPLKISTLPSPLVVPSTSPDATRTCALSHHSPQPAKRLEPSHIEFRIPLFLTSNLLNPSQLLPLASSTSNPIPAGTV